MLDIIIRSFKWRRLFRIFVTLIAVVIIFALLSRIPPRQTNTVWIKPKPGNVVLHQHQISYTIQNPSLCTKTSLSEKDPNYFEPFLFIFVESAPHNFDRRTEWRNYWGKYKQYKNHKVVIAFLLALTKNETVRFKITQEQLIHDDIIQMNYIDSYENLTTKTIGGIHWTVSHCPRARFVMKTDDDVIIFIPKLVEYLRKLSPYQEENLYTGYASRYHEVQRSEGDRWQVSKEEYPFTLYPPYILGMGILISNRVLNKIHNASLYIPKFKFEDIYIGMCTRFVGIKRRNNKGFVHFFGPEFNDFLCEYGRMKDEVLLVHGLEGNRSEFYEAVRNGQRCEQGGVSSTVMGLELLDY